jgi:hypothetical protein
MPSAVTLPAPSRAPWWTDLTDEQRAFLVWIACWLVLPNLPFLPITVMGGPPRFPDVLACGLVGLIARRLNYPGRAAVWLALMAFLVLNFIARMFNMALSMLFSVAMLVFDLQPAASLEYLAGGAILLFVFAAGLWLLRRTGTFEQPRQLIGAMMATLALTGADYLASKDTMGSYARLAPAGAPFSSASSQSGFAALADGKTNVMIVMVEAMGEPLDPALRRTLDAIWLRPELANRFELVRGDTPFYGSTTSGELRELCGRWGNYPELVAPDPTCLPAQLARQGYQTSAYHAFVPSFFERDRWYPLIGLQRSVWGQEMLKGGAQICPNVFPGACDRDVPRMIGKQLQNAAGPQFVYWLTLNSHLPIVENRELGTLDCKGAGAEIDRDLPMVCRLFAIWRGTADALYSEISRPDFPPTHILIVGDHMPPFTHQQSRVQFDPERVPWILLRWKDAGSEAPQSDPAR